MSSTDRPCTAFAGARRLASGPLPRVALAVKRALEAAPDAAVLVFDDVDGRVVDLDLRGDDAAIVARLAPETPRPRGRPKLGVVPREVTLLPRHWEWLAAQPGGASVALRRLVEAASRDEGGRRRAGQDAAYRFMSAVAGDLAGFEDALRALFAGDRDGFAAAVNGWPDDLRAHATALAFRQD